MNGITCIVQVMERIKETDETVDSKWEIVSVG